MVSLGPSLYPKPRARAWPQFHLTHLVGCSDNYIAGLGATVLANALQKNSSLRELYIKGNELKDTGAEALCKAFTGAD